MRIGSNCKGSALPLSANHRGLSFLPSTVHFVIQGSALTLLDAFISIYSRFLEKCGPVRALQRRILDLFIGIETMTSRTTPKTLSHILKITNHASTGCPPHGQEYRQLFACGPRSSRSVIRPMSLNKSPRNTPHNVSTSSSSSRTVSTIPATGSLSATARCLRTRPILQYFRPQRPSSTFTQLNFYNRVSTV